MLVANNLRDIPTDKESGKITLAVRLGDARTRLLYQALVLVAFVVTLVLMFATPWCAVGLVAMPLAVRAAGPVRKGLGGKDLIPVLRFAQRRGLHAAIVGSDRTAGALKDLADAFISYRQLLEGDDLPRRIPLRGGPQVPRQQAGKPGGADKRP